MHAAAGLSAYDYKDQTDEPVGQDMDYKTLIGAPGPLAFPQTAVVSHSNLKSGQQCWWTAHCVRCHLDPCTLTLLW